MGSSLFLMVLKADASELEPAPCWGQDGILSPHVFWVFIYLFILSSSSEASETAMVGDKTLGGARAL